MGHCRALAAEKILDKEYTVLNHGFVRLVDYMGSDERIVQAARVSYGGGTRAVRENEALIDYLLRNAHTSPFEQVVFTFHAKMPIFVARQWVRHRTARLNEVSGRYSQMPDEFYLPDTGDISKQSTDNKQGRENQPMETEIATDVQDRMRIAHSAAYECYKGLIQEETARELARIVLPLSLYTEWYWQIDLHNLFHFLRLRLDPHAQIEIRAYATVIKDIASQVCPIAFDAFERHQLGGVRFSKEEMQALNRLLSGKHHGLSGKAANRFETKLKEGRQV